MYLIIILVYCTILVCSIIVAYYNLFSMFLCSSGYSYNKKDFKQKEIYYRLPFCLISVFVTAKVPHSFLQLVCLPLSFLHHSSLHRFLFFIKCLQGSVSSLGSRQTRSRRNCSVSQSRRPSPLPVTGGMKDEAADRKRTWWGERERIT